MLRDFESCDVCHRDMSPRGNWLRVYHRRGEERVHVVHRECLPALERKGRGGVVCKHPHEERYLYPYRRHMIP